MEMPRDDELYTGAMELSVVPRLEWGAIPPKEDIEALPHPIKNIGYSFTTEVDNVCRTKEECIEVVKQLQKRDMEERGLPDIGYNFLIGDDGNVYEGRGWDKRPAIYYDDKTKYDNMIDVAYIGIPISKFIHYEMYESLKCLIKFGKQHKYVAEDNETTNLNPSEIYDL